MNIKGSIFEIVFRNEENGYTIATVDYNGHPVTAVGIFPPVTEGHYVTMTGEFSVHPKYGRQFKADSVRLDKPNSDLGIMMFLGSGLIKGLGPKRAEAIVRLFGKDTFDVLENSPEKLARVRGISRQTAMRISESYTEVSSAADALSFLMDYGIGSGTAMKIYKTYGKDTVAVVSANPYTLIEDVLGVGFLTADKMAAKLGIDSRSDFRVRAGIFYALGEAAEKNGNTCLPKKDVLDYAEKVLALDDAELIEKNLEDMLLARRIISVDCDGETGVMLSAYYAAEKSSAAKLIKLIEYNNRVGGDFTDEIARFEKLHKMTFHETQRRAIALALGSGVSVITGGPGTGKTTIVKCIIGLLLDAGRTVSLMAPTGRAAKRLADATGQPASTIHRALMSEDGFIADYIIVDEFSMVDIVLLSRMLGVMLDETKLVIVGDSDQLPSVGAGNVLSDVISSTVVPVVRLTQIFRQEETSRIVLNAHKINAGECPSLVNDSPDFFFIKCDQPKAATDVTVDLVSRRLPQYLHCEPKNIQVLCPMKNGEAGCVNLNRRLRAVLVPKGEEITIGDNTFSVGDKVMHVVNNYNLEWRRGIETGTGVFNGDMGFITALRTGSGEVDVTFEDGRTATYLGEDRFQLMPAYAVTVHKSQGSEYDGVVIVLTGGNYMIMTRNLLYTAITRAKSLVVLVGEEETVRKMVRNNFIQKRYSQLKNFIVTEKRKSDLLFEENRQ